MINLVNNNRSSTADGYFIYNVGFGLLFKLLIQFSPYRDWRRYEQQDKKRGWKSRRRS